MEGEPIRDGAVVVGDDGRIAAVGSARELGEGERFPESVILPAFVNAHSHLEYAVYPGFGDGLHFPDWIGLHVERKSRIGIEEMEVSARLGALECLRSGIATVGDASFSGAAATAAAAAGLRAIVYVEVFGEDEGALDRFHEISDRIAGVLSERVRLGVSPHAPYTCTLAVYRACGELGLPVATHLAESDQEREYLLTGGGPWERFGDLLVPPLGTTGIRALAAEGLLGPHVLAAHCVTADEDEIGLLAEHGVAVAHCPRSNGVLGCGIAPLAALRAAGLRVAIASDSPASTPSFDMFEELRTAIVAARMRERRPDALTAAGALELATLGGARALGLESEVGSLVPGKEADLTVLSLAGTPYVPWEDPVTAAVYGGSPERVVATLVAGESRYERGSNTWHELIDVARSVRAQLLSLDAR